MQVGRISTTMAQLLLTMRGAEAHTACCEPLHASNLHSRSVTALTPPGLRDKSIMDRGSNIAQKRVRVHLFLRRFATDRRFLTLIK